ncbi:MAG: tRNA pseudouridine(55) synthase TruB [Propionibacteriaceae bacterium]|nr:tRNA pseudouridine(55) synthase TruB [Propionibacteriaceae bacterium]
MDPTASGLLVIDKPAGLTSQQVVSRVKRALGVRKAGHAGTLDPMATGVLVVGIGRATRLLGYLLGQDKQYRATIRLGMATVTDDAEGDPITAPTDATGLDAARIAQAMSGYLGEISQVPSAVSAVKVDGKRAYARVRAGEDVQLKARQVRLSRFDLLACRKSPPFTDVDVLVDCSSGTYIRALARDIGNDLGVGGHLRALRRTQVGAFGLAAATGIPDPASPPALISLEECTRWLFDTLDVDAEAAADIRYGRAIGVRVPADPTAVFSDGSFLALYRPAGGGSAPVAVFVG